MAAELKEGISTTYSNVSYSLYYVRKCKVFKLPFSQAYDINFGFSASFDNTCTYFHLIFQPMKDIYLIFFKIKGREKYREGRKSGQESTKWMGKKREVT